jgi:hypothetical protein
MYIPSCIFFSIPTVFVYEMMKALIGSLHQENKVELPILIPPLGDFNLSKNWPRIKSFFVYLIRHSDLKKITPD